MATVELINYIFNLDYKQKSKFLSNVGIDSYSLQGQDNALSKLSDKEARVEFYSDLDSINSFEAQQLKLNIALNYDDIDTVISIWNSSDVNLIRYSVQRSDKIYNNELFWPKFEDVLDNTSFVARKKILKKVTSLNLPNICEIGFNWLLKHYGLNDACDMLAFCSEDFIRAILKENYKSIPSEIIEKLIRTRKGHLVFPYIVEGLKSSKKTLEYINERYLELVMRHYPQQFFDYFTNYYFKTRSLNGNWYKIIRLNPQVVYDKVFQNLVEVGIPDFMREKKNLQLYSEEQVLKLFKAFLTKENYQVQYIYMLSLVSRLNRFTIVGFCYRMIEKSKRYHFLLDLIRSTDRFELLDYSSKTKVLEVMAQLDEKRFYKEFAGSFLHLELKSNFKQKCILSVSKNYEELLNLVKRYGTEVNDRSEALKLMFSTMVNDKDHSELVTTFLNMVYERYRNDQPQVHSQWISCLRHDYSHRLNWTQIQSIIKLIENWKLKPTQNAYIIRDILDPLWKILILSIERRVSKVTEFPNLLDLEQCTALLTDFVKVNCEDENTKDYFKNTYIWTSRYSRTGEFKSTFHIELIEKSIDKLYPNLLKSENKEYMRQVINGFESLFNRNHLVKAHQIERILQIFSNPELENSCHEIVLNYHSVRPVEKEFLFKIHAKFSGNSSCLFENVLFDSPQSIYNFLRQSYQVKESAYSEMHSTFPRLTSGFITKLRKYGYSIYNRLSIEEKQIVLKLSNEVLMGGHLYATEKEYLITWLSNLPQWWANIEDISKYLPPLSDSEDVKQFDGGENEKFVLVDEDDHTNEETKEVSPNDYSNQQKSKFLTSITRMPNTDKALEIIHPYFNTDYSSLVLQPITNQIKRYSYNAANDKIQNILSKGVKITVQKSLSRLMLDLSYSYDKDSNLKRLWGFCRRHPSLVRTLLDFIPDIVQHIKNYDLLFEICEATIVDPTYYEQVVRYHSVYMIKSSYKDKFIQLVLDSFPKKDPGSYYALLREFMRSWSEFINDDFFFYYLKEFIFSQNFTDYLVGSVSYLHTVCYSFKYSWDNMNRMSVIIKHFEILFKEISHKKKSKAVIKTFVSLTCQLSSAFKFKRINEINRSKIIENFEQMIKLYSELMNSEVLSYMKYPGYFRICRKLIQIENNHLYKNQRDEYYKTVASQCLQILLGVKFNLVSYHPQHLTFFEEGINSIIYSPFREVEQRDYFDDFLSGLEPGFDSPLIISSMLKLLISCLNSIQGCKGLKIKELKNCTRILTNLMKRNEYRLILKSSLCFSLEDYEN